MCLLIGVGRLGIIVAELEDGTMISSNNYNIIPEPKCTGWDWKPVKSLKVGCKTFTINDNNNIVYDNGMGKPKILTTVNHARGAFAAIKAMGENVGHKAISISFVGHTVLMSDLERFLDF